LQLVDDIVQKTLDLAGGRARFGVEPLGQERTLVAVAEPRLTRPVGE
jgi:hypothetical protein